MATESFFIHVELTDRDVDVVRELIRHIEDESLQYSVSKEKIQEMREKEEEGTKEVLEWLKTI